MIVREFGWRIEMLGGLRVSQGDRAISRFSTRKAGALLAYLACYHRNSHSREYLAELLWPEESGPTVRNRLNQAVWALRQDLAAASEILLSDRLSLQIHPDVATDVADFYAALQQAEQAGGRAAKKLSLQRAVALYRGELLPGYYEEWMQAERQRLADSFLGALRELSALAGEEQDWPLALRYIRRAIAVEPLLEEAYLEGIRFALQAERLPEALRLYRALEQMVRQEYDGALSDEARALFAQIEQRSSHKAKSPAASEQSSAGSAAEIGGCDDVLLPAPLTLFFGREDEIVRILELLRAGRKRLITLLGLGGSGKTRLAIEAARRFAGEFPGRAAFISLVDVTDAADIPERISIALGLERPESGPILEQVIETLREEPALLLLDNLEHLPEVAPLLRRLLESVPTLRLLATSRRKLGVEGEQEIPVPPLPLPTEADLSEPLLACPSIQLFLDRAQSVRPDFALTSENAADVVSLCQILEGIPLATELCAAWAAALTPAQMRLQLAHRFELLVSRLVDMPDRHRSLYAVIESSFTRLPADLRRFFCALSLFRGWTLEAAESLASHLQIGADCSGIAQEAASRNGSPDGWAREALAQLLECSLILAETNGSEMRYRMLESLREFASRQMTPQEREQAYRAHAHYFRQLIEQAEPRLRGEQDQLVWMQRLEADYENLRMALHTCLEMGDIEQGMQLATDLWVFWERTGRLAQAAEWLDRFLTLPETQKVNPSLRAKARCRQGFIAWRRGDFETAQTALEQGYQLAQQQEDFVNMGRARQLMGIAANAQGNLALARAHLEESLALFRSIGHKAFITLTIYNLGSVVFREGNHDEAASLYQAALESWQATGFEEAAAKALMGLGTVAMIQDRSEEAQEKFLESLAMFCRCGSHRIEVLQSIEMLAAVAQDLGDDERTVRLYAATLAQRETIQAPLELPNQKEAEVILEKARERLGAEQFNSLWAEGQTITLEELLHEASHPEESRDDRENDFSSCETLRAI